MRVLLVEDNPRVSEQVSFALVNVGYAVDTVHRGMDAEEKATQAQYDLIVLDMMLPDCDGLDVCRTLRRRGVGSPILMLTSMSDTQEKVSALNAGADDYLTKPFQFDELMARVRALLRRGQATEGSVLRVGGVELDLTERKLSVTGRSVKLGTRELSVLEYLMRHADRVVTRAELHEHVWNESFDAGSNVIDVHISTLRRHLREKDSGAAIQTVVGVGYKLEAVAP